jgi:SanA protein
MLQVIKRIGLAIAGLLVIGGIVLLALNLWVVMSTRDRIAVSPLTCQSHEVGIVFGTSYGLVGGGSNPHYQARLDTAAQLYRLHRVSNLLLSGDNRTRYYNEPMTMWHDLRARNVPQQFMTLDYAGFSTFDTLVRAKKVFGVKEAVLVTQPWHLPRALFIADAIGLDATGCPAVSEQQTPGVRLLLREWLARAATVGDLYLWGRKPRFLGPLERLPTPVLSPSKKLTPASPQAKGEDTSSDSDVHASLPMAHNDVLLPALRSSSVPQADGVASGIALDDELAALPGVQHSLAALLSPSSGGQGVLQTAQ